MGLMLLVGILEASTAPPAEPIKAGTPIPSKIFGSGLICFRYNAAAVVVPKTAESLFVPRTSAVEELGKPINNAGNWIKPPPPAIESTKPAKNEAAKRNKPVARVSSYTAITSADLQWQKLQRQVQLPFYLQFCEDELRHYLQPKLFRPQR